MIAQRLNQAFAYLPSDGASALASAAPAFGVFVSAFICTMPLGYVPGATILL
jgi:hypothetical protein